MSDIYTQNWVDWRYNLTYIYELCVVMPKDLNMRTVVLKKENWVADYIITMFSIISESTSKKEVVIDNNKVSLRDKSENEIYYFEEDLNAFKMRILVDFFQKSPSYTLTLNPEESSLFLKCSHAAYYFETERNKKNESPRKRFLEIHEENFKI